MDFTELYCNIDDYLKNNQQNLLAITSCKAKTGPRNSLSISEVLTILIGYHKSSFDCFKNYYIKTILLYHQRDFKLVSYVQFIRLIKDTLSFLTLILNNLFDKCTGISFVDSTSIPVCENYRIYSHQVFEGFAKRSKTTKGWFYGLKLHLVINPEGGLVKASFSFGNKDDRKHFRTMTNGIFGKVFGDRGYVSKELFDDLMPENVQLITRIKKGMKNIFMPVMDKILLLKRVLIESVIGRIKLLDKLVHTRHRSPVNAFSHMMACLINYQLLDNKPSIASLLRLDDLSCLS